jgi:hypothetical protein
MKARNYLYATEQQASYIDKLLEATAPKEHARLKRVAKAGRWYTELDERCFLGLATVWKLQVGCHLDANDWELCVITCAGNFRGGQLYLPDLGLCLSCVYSNI